MALGREIADLNRAHRAGYSTCMPHRPNTAQNHSPENRAKLAGPQGIASWQWFVLAAGVPLVIGASRLNLDLWHDEIYTVEYFVSRGPKFIATDYSLPNNHVLYSLLLWPVYLFSDSSFMLRLPSLACMAGTLVLVFRLAQRWAGIGAAVLATALLGLNQMFLIHTIQVRGYPLSMLLTVGLATVAMPVDGDHVWLRRALVILAGAAYLYVLPTNLLFFLPLALLAVTAAARGGGIKLAAAETATWSASVFLAAFAYLPIAGQVLKTGGDRGLAVPLGIGARLQQLLSPDWGSIGRLTIGFLSPAARDVWWLGPLLFLGWLIWALRRSQSGTRCPRFGLALVAATWCGAFLLCGALHVSPFERNFCPLLPLTAVAAGCLLDELLMSVGARISPRWSPPWTAVCGLLLLLATIGPRLASYATRLDAHRREAAGQRWPLQDGYYNYYAADYRPSALAAWFVEQHVERMPYNVCLAKEDYLDVAYYVNRAGLPLVYGMPVSGGKQLATVFAIAPDGAPWSRLAESCDLTERQLRSFEHVADFGYHQLYQSRRPLPVDYAPDDTSVKEARKEKRRLYGPIMPRY